MSRPIAASAAAPPVALDVDLVATPGPPAGPAAPRTRSSPPLGAPPSVAGEILSERPVRADGFRAVVRLLVVVGVIVVSIGVVSTVGVSVLIGLGFFTPEEVLTGKVLEKRPVAADRDAIWGKARNLKGGDERAFRLLLGRQTWVPDKDLKNRLAALGAWMNKQDDVWLAIAVKDYGTQKPREAEMLQQAIEKLEAHFGESLELGARAEPVEFASAAAQRLSFKGQAGVVVWWGECTMFSHHGFAYWVFLAGPTLNDIRAFDDELKKEETGLSLVTERKGWRAQPPKTESFTSADGAITVTAPDGVWEKVTPNVEFETGTLLLLGRYQKEKDNTKNAHLQVFTMEKQADLKEAARQAKEYVEKQKKELNSAYRLGPAPDAGASSDLGAVEDIGNRRGRLVELVLSQGETPARYYLMALVGEPEHVTVLLYDCNWKSRQIWRQDFLDLLRTCKVRAKG